MYNQKIVENLFFELIQYMTSYVNQIHSTFDAIIQQKQININQKNQEMINCKNKTKECLKKYYETKVITEAKCKQINQELTKLFTYNFDKIFQNFQEYQIETQVLESLITNYQDQHEKKQKLDQGFNQISMSFMNMLDFERPQQEKPKLQEIQPISEISEKEQKSYNDEIDQKYKAESQLRLNLTSNNENIYQKTESINNLNSTQKNQANQQTNCQQTSNSPYNFLTTSQNQQANFNDTSNQQQIFIQPTNQQHQKSNSPSSTQAPQINFTGLQNYQTPYPPQQQLLNQQPIQNQQIPNPQPTFYQKSNSPQSTQPPQKIFTGFQNYQTPNPTQQVTNPQTTFQQIQNQIPQSTFNDTQNNQPSKTLFSEVLEKSEVFEPSLIHEESKNQQNIQIQQMQLQQQQQQLIANQKQQTTCSCNKLIKDIQNCIEFPGCKHKFCQDCFLNFLATEQMQSKSQQPLQSFHCEFCKTQCKRKDLITEIYDDDDESLADDIDGKMEILQQ